MKFTRVFTTLSLSAAALAANIPRGTFPPADAKVVDAATYNATAKTDDLPGVGRRDTLAKRDAGNVYLCNNANWVPYCVYITDAGSGECVNLADDLSDQVSSFGPDPNQSCYAYAGFDCDPLSGQIGPLRAPGAADLSQPQNTGQEGGGRPFNDVISSYKCIYDFF